MQGWVDVVEDLANYIPEDNLNDNIKNELTRLKNIIKNENLSVLKRIKKAKPQYKKVYFDILEQNILDQKNIVSK